MGINPHEIRMIQMPDSHWMWLAALMAEHPNDPYAADIRDRIERDWRLSEAGDNIGYGTCETCGATCCTVYAFRGKTCCRTCVAIGKTDEHAGS